MEIYRNTKSTPDGSGTTYYYITEDQLLKFYDKSDNVIMRYLVSENGFDAFYIEGVPGYAMFDDILYICDTDGADIMVNGKSIDPERALMKYTPDDLSEYEERGTDSIIKRYLSEYELAEFDPNEVVLSMLDTGFADFKEIVKSAKDLGWV